MYTVIINYRTQYHNDFHKKVTISNKHLSQKWLLKNIHVCVHDAY